MEKEILEILKRLEKGQKNLENGLRKLEDGQKKLEDGQSKLEDGQRNLEDGQKRLEIRVDENTQILRALEHSAEVNKSEHDKMANDIAKIQGDVAGIRKDLSQVELVTANNWADIVKLKAVK